MVRPLHAKNNRPLFYCMILLAASLWVLNVSLDAAEITIEKDVVYGKGGDVDLKLDLARPTQGDGPFPAIVFVHGGGWLGGSRETHEKDIKHAAELSYVAVTITYRLTDPDEKGKPRTPFPAQIEDAKCAVRWLRANAKMYHIDPNRIGAGGGSAGGHLSLLLGTTDEKAGLEGSGGHADQSSRVQAVVNYFGPTDLVRAHATSVGGQKYFETLTGGTPETAAAVYAAASPVTHLSKDDPPMLTLHGSEDKLVPPDQAQLFDAKAKEVGASHTLMILVGQGHGFKGESNDKAYQAMFEFFDRHLKPEKK
ncbi:MAG: alpha/beta hydrolase [Planctomycetaceae bacterium]